MNEEQFIEQVENRDRMSFSDFKNKLKKGMFFFWKHYNIIVKCTVTRITKNGNVYFTEAYPHTIRKSSMDLYGLYAGRNMKNMLFEFECI